VPIITYREAIAAGLREELARDERVFIIGEEVGFGAAANRVTAGMLAEFGERRIRAAPRSAATIVPAAIGAAIGGLMPVVELGCLTPLFLAAAPLMGHPNLPLVIRAPLAADPPAGAGLGPLATGFAGVRVIAPGSPAEAKGMLKAAIRCDRPVIVLEHQALYETRGEVSADPDCLAPLEGAGIIREGSGLTIAAHSRALGEAARAATALAGCGVSAEVIDLRALVPLDAATVAASIAKTGRAIVAGEGLADLAARIYRIAFASLRAPLEVVTGERASDIVEVALQLA
jgi:pyruvate dehydrogenase E1 component beta subunit